MGGDILLKLNIGERPIANKYREGKMKSTLERELNSMRSRRKQANQWVLGTAPRAGYSGECVLFLHSAARLTIAPGRGVRFWCPASASLLIRPVLKHGPRSLICVRVLG